MKHDTSLHIRTTHEQVDTLKNLADRMDRSVSQTTRMAIQLGLQEILRHEFTNTTYLIPEQDPTT